MRHRLWCLVASGSLIFVGQVATLLAQAIALPRDLDAQPAYAVPDRVLDHQADLALTADQVAQLTALSAMLHAQQRSWEQHQSQSSKPWITAAQRPVPRDAFRWVLAVLDSAQRLNVAHAVDEAPAHAGWHPVHR